MNKALKTYKELIERKAIYNYIAEADISYWWDYAKEEDYDIWLADKCEYSSTRGKSSDNLHHCTEYNL